MAGSLALTRLLPMGGQTALALAVAFGLAFAGLSYALDPLARNVLREAAAKLGVSRFSRALQRESL